MTVHYHTQVVSSLFDGLISMLSVDGVNKVLIISDTDVVLAECTLPSKNFVKSRTNTTLQLIATDTVIALEDGTATTGKLVNSNGDVVMYFDVGSPTVNSTAELLLNSVVLYKGGSVTITEINITV